MELDNRNHYYCTNGLESYKTQVVKI